MYNVQWLLFSHMYSVRRYKEGCQQGKGGGLPVESKFGGDNIPLQRCITFFKIDILRVTLIESHTEFKGGGVSAGKFSLVRFFNTTLTS